MIKNLIIVSALLTLAACQTAPPQVLSFEPEEIAQVKTCDQIADHIEAMDRVLDKSVKSDTQELMEDTAVSAAKTGISYSGVLGSAGAFAGLGINLLSGLYKINKNQSETDVLEDIYAQRNALLDAYEIKGCQG